MSVKVMNAKFIYTLPFPLPNNHITQEPAKPAGFVFIKIHKTGIVLPNIHCGKEQKYLRTVILLTFANSFEKAI